MAHELGDGDQVDAASAQSSSTSVQQAIRSSRLHSRRMRLALDVVIGYLAAGDTDPNAGP